MNITGDKKKESEIVNALEKKLREQEINLDVEKQQYAYVWSKLF